MLARNVAVGSGAFAIAAALTLLCVLIIDNPAASFAHSTFHGTAVFIALTHIVDPLLPLATIGFLVIGGALLAGWDAPRPVRVLFGLCIATLLAVMLKDQLKFAFGRTWPETWVSNNPSWIRDGVDSFTPFHGGQGWASFPSGHVTLATAPMAALALALRTRWRWLCAVPVALVAIGLYGADYHYVGDMVAGLMVGCFCAGVAMLVLPRAADLPS